MEYKVEMLFIAQGEALQRFKCAIREEKRIGKLATAHILEDDIWREWKRARQRTENAYRRLDGINKKITEYQSMKKVS